MRYICGVKEIKTPIKNKKFTIMKKEIIVESKKNDSYKLILKVELDEEDEFNGLLKKTPEIFVQ